MSFGAAKTAWEAFKAFASLLSKYKDIRHLLESMENVKDRLDALESIDQDISKKKQETIGADGKKTASQIIDVYLDQDIDNSRETYLEYKSRSYKYREAWADMAFYHVLQIGKYSEEADAFYKETDSLKIQDNPSAVEFAWWLHNEYKPAREAKKV